MGDPEDKRTEGGGLGEGEGLAIAADRGLADDGKRF